MSITGIRPATLEDTMLLARFRVELVREEDGPDADDEALLDRCATWFASELSTAGFRAWIALDAGEPIGTAGYRILPLLPRRGGPSFEARVHNVFVLEAYRNRGIGEALMREVLAEIGRTPYHRVTLGARTRARSFYERLGFEASPDMRLPVSGEPPAPTGGIA